MTIDEALDALAADDHAIFSEDYAVEISTAFGLTTPGIPTMADSREVVHDTLLSRAAGNVLCMTYTSADARAYIAAVRWQFASTMPDIPHWYTIRKWRPELDGAFVAFVRHIRSAGIRMDWPDPPAKPLYHNQYLLLDGWKYWTMGDPHPGVVPPIEIPETTTGINRARIEPPCGGSNLAPSTSG
jgi:hypothetical protein